MPIYQTNTFVCESCGAVAGHTEETGVYDDPVVTPPPGWDDGIDIANHAGEDQPILRCPVCITKFKEAQET